MMKNDTFPVVFGICLDAEAIWVGKAPENLKKPVLLSHGAYAIREGLPPLLDLLDRHAVKASFFIPGMTADRYPEAIREIHRRGHELGSHGYASMPRTSSFFSSADDSDAGGLCA